MTPHYGDVRDDLEPIEPVVCGRCGSVQELDLTRWGLDWPDVLERWGLLDDVAVCPVCCDAAHETTQPEGRADQVHAAIASQRPGQEATRAKEQP